MKVQTINNESGEVKGIGKTIPLSKNRIKLDNKSIVIEEGSKSSLKSNTLGKLIIYYDENIDYLCKQCKKGLFSKVNLKPLTKTEIINIIASFCDCTDMKNLVKSSKFGMFLYELDLYKNGKSNFNTLNDLIKHFINPDKYSARSKGGYRKDTGNIRKLLYGLTNGFIDLLTDKMTESSGLNLTNYHEPTTRDNYAWLYRNILDQQKILENKSVEELTLLYKFY